MAFWGIIEVIPTYVIGINFIFWCTNQKSFPQKRVFNNFFKLSRVLDKVVRFDTFGNKLYISKLRAI